MINLKASALAILAFSGGLAYGQLQINTTLTPQQLVEDVLAGDCVEVSNVTFNGQADAGIAVQGSGSFTNGGATNLGIGEGLILSSGQVGAIAAPASSFQSGALVPNYTADVDLQAITGVGIQNASVLEFDFVPNGDSILFRYVFGSEEYPEFVCSQFNDAFGFFLSGPGINGPFSDNAINLALIPGTTTPVAINTVNSGTPGGAYPPSTCAAADPNWQANSIYYVDNASSTTIVYDGLTVVLTARAVVQCGETYHIKLAIADASDGSFDSGVFLEAGSFSSVPYVPELLPAPSIVGNTILESCLELSMEIQRTACDLTLEETIQMSYSGTAEMGVDITPAFPTELTFGPGESSITFPFFAPVDPDGPETFNISIEAVDCSGELTTTVFEFVIDELPPLALPTASATIDCGDSTVIVPVVSGGFGNYSYSWSTGDTTSTLAVTPNSSTTYTLTVTDLCDAVISTDYPVLLSPAPPLNMNILGPTDILEGCEQAQVNIIRPQFEAGDITITLTTSGSATPGTDYLLPGSVVIGDDLLNLIVDVPTIADQIVEGNETVIITGSYTNACSQTVTDQVEFTIIDVEPIQVFANDIAAECGPDSLLILASVTGGVGPYQYQWSTGDQGSGIFVPLLENGQVAVSVVDACGNEGAASALIIIDCDIIIPNVFTPNGDGTNDTWRIEGLSNRPNVVRVYNRWGQVVLDTKNYRSNWGAQDVPDGTYFYEVIVEGKGDPFTGHVTILRNRW